jgi:hypothetical protein
MKRKNDEDEKYTVEQIEAFLDFAIKNGFGKRIVDASRDYKELDALFIFNHLKEIQERLDEKLKMREK